MGEKVLFVEPVVKRQRHEQHERVISVWRSAQAAEPFLDAADGLTLQVGHAVVGGVGGGLVQGLFGDLEVDGEGVGEAWRKMASRSPEGDAPDGGPWCSSWPL